MNSTATILAVKGDTVCRDSDWQDVARFFALNYGLHIFTVHLLPGISPANTLFEYVLSLVIPIYGVTEATESILNCARRQPDQLHTALKAGALCMVVPGEYENKEDNVPRRTIIHGQFPATVWAEPKNTENEAGVKRWCIRSVPKSFTVVPLIGASAVPLQLSCNYSFLAAAAGIVQVLSGSMQIYHASGREIPNFGYAAYSLTVVPYLFMSVFNLVGSMCQPQYPTRFLVRYRGPKAPEDPFIDNDEMRLLPLKEVGTEQPVESELWTEPELGGTVGDAYGDLSETTEDTNLFSVLNYSFLLVLAVAPYMVIGALTGFRSANSTLAQRAWIMSWLVSGQVSVVLIVGVMELRQRLGFSREGPALRAFGRAAGMVILGVVVVCAIGGYVVVAQMILEDKVCFRA